MYSLKTLMPFMAAATLAATLAANNVYSQDPSVGSPSIEVLQGQTLPSHQAAQLTLTSAKEVWYHDNAGYYTIDRDSKKTYHDRVYGKDHYDAQQRALKAAGASQPIAPVKVS